tara:strand:+ start:179 stop:826 length:648 start_codon:yes stop_codon:yes gene_type:complete
MTETKFLKDFITVKIQDEKISSTFSKALKDARLITGRDLTTGKSKNFLLQNSNGQILKPYSPIGILNYLIVLEMIGNLFHPFDESNTNGKGIPAALRQFSKLNEKEQFTIDAFRNGLAHGYSLINIPSNPKYNDNSRHRFVYTAFHDIPIIKFPTKPWNGMFSDEYDNSSTWIQLNELFELIEQIISKVDSGIENNEVKLKIPIAEIKARYLIHS